MKFEDSQSGIAIDSEFPCGSAGAVRALESALYEIAYQPEEIPRWFQDTLDELFAGAGVPKEYMAQVRVRCTADAPRRVRLRFLLSGKGSNYMYPPWWIRRQDGGWNWIPPEDLDFREHAYVDVALSLQPGESVQIASAPYEEPEAVCEKARRLAQRHNIWTYREIGTSGDGRPLPLLETAPRPLKLLVDATMQSSEPVSWGILHVAHWLTIPTARARGLLEHVQFCLLPMTNPDGVYRGRSVTNASGEVPKFGINNLVEGRGAARETELLWNFLLELQPDASIEVHAHFTREDFTRSIGMHEKTSMPAHLQAKAGIIEDALFANYHVEPLQNRKVCIDPRLPEHNVYGDRYVSERAGTIRTFLQAIPDSIESHGADVREMVETVAAALIRWQESQPS